jgi:ADP-heptose:LPS heptosyltransferase
MRNQRPQQLDQAGVKIALIRLSSIGDVVLCTPVIRWLHRRFPQAELHFVTKAAMAPVLQHHPVISKVHLLESHNEQELLLELHQLAFDGIIDLQSNWRTLKWKFRLAPPGSGVFFRRFKKNNFQKWWMVQTKSKPSRFLHTVQKYAKLLEPWGIQDDGLGLDWSFDPALKTLPDGVTFLQQELGWAPRLRVTAIAIGAQHATKCLPKEKVLALCNLLDGPILLLGGPQDKALAEQILQSANHRRDMAHGCGRWTLQQSAKALSECACLITPDTGMMHIGAALGIKLLVVWGNTVPEFGMHPWLPHNQGHPQLTNVLKHGSPLKPSVIEPMEQTLPEYFEVDLACRPCSKLGHASCPRGHFDCMMKQDIGLIASTAQRFDHFPRHS